MTQIKQHLEYCNLQYINVFLALSKSAFIPRLTDCPQSYRWWEHWYLAPKPVLNFCQIRSQMSKFISGLISQSNIDALKTDLKPFCCRSLHSGAALWTWVRSRPRHPAGPPLAHGELPASALRLPPVCLLPGWVVGCVGWGGDKTWSQTCRLIWLSMV